jgi:hypothetical protein
MLALEGAEGNYLFGGKEVTEDAYFIGGKEGTEGADQPRRSTTESS